MSRTTPFRRGAVAVVIGVGLAVAAPVVASAHVGVSPDTMPTDASAVLTFSFSHGCEGSPTTALRVTMPDGLASVAPTVDGVWDIAVERGDDGLVSAVTYTALTPIPSDLRGAASMQVRPAEDAAESLAFPVVQTCETGATEWVELAEDGQDPHELEAPAPVVALSAAAGSDHGDHASNETTDADSSGATEAAASDPVAIVLGTGGLVAGVAALIVSILAYRRRSA
jgi:uncharacterized protein YcnI